MPGVRRCINFAGNDPLCGWVLLKSKYQLPKIQTIIKKHDRQGYASIIIGDKNHPGVIGLQ